MIFLCFFPKIFSLIFSFYFSQRPQKIFSKFSDNSVFPNPFIIIPFLVSLRLSIFYLYVIHWLTLLLGVYTSLLKFLVTSPLLTCLHFLSLPSIRAHFFHSTPFLLYKTSLFFVPRDLPQFHWEVMRQMAYDFYSIYFSGIHSNFGPLSCAPNIRAHFFAIDTFQSLLLMRQ